MSGSVDNMVLEQLGLTREDMGEIRNEMSGVKDSIDTVEAKVDGVALISVNLGSNIHNRDKRVSHIEEKLGIE